VLMHAFDGRAVAARAGLDAGFYFSVPPSIVRSRQKQKLVRALPLDRLLLETDSPVLGATPTERNEPACVRTSLSAVAEAHGVAEEHVAEETTKNALAGGMRALAEHPEEWEKLGRRPELAPDAVEEVVRWATPVNYMMRTAARDVELSGKKIREGDQLLLFYASANRDEDVFEDPFVFRVDRAPNRHLGFGIGEHFCLGAHLARRSQRALFAELPSETLRRSSPARVAADRARNSR